MKILSTAVVITVFGASMFSFNTQAANVDALQGICDSVSADNKSRFRKKLKDSGLKLRDVYDAISCGGDNLVRFAMKSNANDVGDFIVKRLPASHFAQSGDIDWAGGNGFDGSAIVAAIKSR